MSKEAHRIRRLESDRREFLVGVSALAVPWLGACAGSNAGSSAPPEASPPVSSSPRPAAATAHRVAPHVEMPAPEVLPASASISCERVVTIVGRNHGHVLDVSEADVRAGSSRSYALRGSSDHDHVLTLSPDDFALVASGQVLRLRSEFGAGHRHRVLVRCEALVLPEEKTTVCDVTIAGQDGHELVVPESHVRGGVDRDYDVQGVSGHTHRLVVRAADFSRLLAGESLDLLTSESAGHFHHAYVRYVGPS